jgi:hypothetical protein
VAVVQQQWWQSATESPLVAPCALCLCSHAEGALRWSTAFLLDQGWRWGESKWHVDLSGLASNSVDDEGWTYAVDFPWIKFPPAPDSGKK